MNVLLSNNQKESLTDSRYFPHWRGHFDLYWSCRRPKAIWGIYVCMLNLYFKPTLLYNMCYVCILNRRWNSYFVKRIPTNNPKQFLDLLPIEEGTLNWSDKEYLRQFIISLYTYIESQLRLSISNTHKESPQYPRFSLYTYTAPSPQINNANDASIYLYR